MILSFFLLTRLVVFRHELPAGAGPHGLKTKSPQITQINADFFLALLFRLELNFLIIF
jgi:hypothetical protein